MPTRGEVAVKLGWAALAGVIAVGVAQGWGVMQICMGGLALAVTVVVLNRWIRR